MTATNQYLICFCYPTANGSAFSAALFFSFSTKVFSLDFELSQVVLQYMCHPLEATFLDNVTSTIPQINIETNDKFYRKAAFLMYTEMVNFRPQSLKAASKLKPHRGLGIRLPSS